MQVNQSREMEKQKPLSYTHNPTATTTVSRQLSSFETPSTSLRAQVIIGHHQQHTHTAMNRRHPHTCKHTRSNHKQSDTPSRKPHLKHGRRRREPSQRVLRVEVEQEDSLPQQQQTHTHTLAAVVVVVCVCVASCRRKTTPSGRLGDSVQAVSPNKI